MNKEITYPFGEFDLIQLLFSKHHDHQMHGVLDLNGHINEALLKKAVIKSEKNLPHILCRVEKRYGREFWEMTNFSADEIVKVIESNLYQKDIMENLVKATDTYMGPQLAIKVLRDKTHDVLVIVMNHMLCDGAGFKEYLYLLCDLYNNLSNGKTLDVNYDPNKRNLNELVMLMKNKVETEGKVNKEKVKEKVIKVSLEGDENNPFIIIEKISKADFALIKEFAKKEKVTINDIFVTIYILTLKQKFKLPISTMTCPVDLRKYLPNKKANCLSNFTSNLKCYIDDDMNMNFKKILKQVSVAMKKEKESNSCLKSILLLHKVYIALPYFISKKIISTILKNPPIAITNIGILEKEKLKFDNILVKEGFVTGAIKHVPNFQMAISTFDNMVTLSINLYGSKKDEMKIKEFLKELKLKLINEVV